MDKIPVIQSNYLTSARYDYDVCEKRIIYHILILLKNDFFNGIDDAALSKDMDVIIPDKQLRKTDANDNYLRDYRKAVKRLREKSFSIDLPNGEWIETGFLLRGQYRNHIGLELTVSRDILGYLYDLSRGFTAMDATVAITLSSKYAQRFYEWCCRWRDIGRFTYTPDELREVLGLSQPTKWLKQFVVDVAQRGIKELYDAGISELYFDYNEKRGGRGRGGSVQRWTFTIHNRNGKEKEKAQNRDFVFVVQFLQGVYENQPAIAEGILAAVSVDHETLKNFSNRLNSIQINHERKPIKNIGGYIRSIARSEYGFEEGKTKGERQTQSKKQNQTLPKQISDIINLKKR